MASIDDELGGIAADPSTDWETLHWIAENHPSLRAAVAENPATYPELLEALASLGDPAIDAALTRRANAATDETHSSSGPDQFGDGDPIDGDPIDDTDHTGEVDPVPADEPERPAQNEWFATGSFDPDAAGIGYSTISSPIHSTPGRTAAPARPATPARPAAPPRRRRSRAPKILLAVLLPILLLVSVTALALSLLDGGSPEGPTATETEETDQSAEDGGEEPAQEPTASPTPEPPTPEELRAEVAALPADSSCESPAEDGEVLAALASATSEEGAWVESEDGTLVQESLIGLQESCGSAHAAALFLDLRGSEETASALRGTAQEMGSAWIRTSFPAQGQPLSSFVSPDGNVLCELSDTLRCRVLQHTFPAPEGCTEGVTYRIRVDRTAEPDCANPVPQQGQPVLGYGQTASNEFFACTAFQSQMSCWNQLTGEGINLSVSRNFTY